jgi:hypothetical protein
VGVAKTQSMNHDPYDIERNDRVTYYMASLSLENLPVEVGRLKLRFTISSIRDCSYHGLRAYQHRIGAYSLCRHLR